MLLLGAAGTAPEAAAQGAQGAVVLTLDECLRAAGESNADIRGAALDLRAAELQREETRHTLESEVAQAYQQMLGSGKEFVQASKKAEAAQLAYDAVAGKYERGIVSALDRAIATLDESDLRRYRRSIRSL